MEQKSIDRNRRYVSGRESLAYILFDSSKSFNIDKYNDRFLLDVLKIDLDLRSLAAFINGIWDIVNDSFVGALVDKTATRWGKFRPYLLAFAVPGTILTCLYWLLPIFFGTDPYHIPKFIAYLLLIMLKELTVTFQGLTETGLLGTITHNPDDRVRLFAVAEVVSGIWESIPEVLMALLIDLINRRMIGVSMRSAYVSMGVFCAAACGVLGIFFAVAAKERVPSSSHGHSYRDGLRSIINNRPMLMILLADITASITINTGVQNYFIDVLGSASISEIILIPGIPLSLLSYTYFQKLRQRVSVKSMWIFGQHLSDVTSIAVFFFGCIGGVKDGFYRQIRYMLPAFMLRDMLYKGTLSLNKIPSREILLDALDYGEWKNGYRGEGVTLTAKGMVHKLAGNVIGSFNSMVMKRIGYSLNAGFGGQSDKTKFGLFALCMFVPAVMKLLSIIPKLLYNINGETRERMYAELSAARAAKFLYKDEDAELSAAD